MHNIFLELLKNYTQYYGYTCSFDESQKEAIINLSYSYIKIQYLENIQSLGIQIPFAPKMEENKEIVYEKLLSLNYAFSYKKGITFALDDDFLCVQNQIALMDLNDEKFSHEIEALNTIIVNELEELKNFIKNSFTDEKEQATELLLMNMLKV